LVRSTCAGVRGHCLIDERTAVAKPFDLEGAVIYAVELVLWIGIITCGIAYNLRAWLSGRADSEAGGALGLLLFTLS
jgi:hypothetical protein